jgi:ABC-2 type transport system ATP-binding protein
MIAESSDVLEVRQLCKRYTDFALEDLSFTLPRGYIMGLIGPNGAGKTTTLKLIQGLLHRDEGAIRVFGLDPARQGPEIRARVGFVHDDPQFYRALTLAQNAELVARFYHTWDESAFRRNADAFDLPMAKRFGTLSRGNKTKFALALALSHRAELLLLDEPTSGLDPIFRRDLLDTLRGLLHDERTSILFSTHITSDLERIADYLTLIQGGRLVFSAIMDEILERWAMVKGGLELLDGLPTDAFRGLRRGAHGFEALTDDVSAVREQFGDSVVIDKATLEDILLYTTRGAHGA